MNSNEPETHLKEYVEIQCEDRWQAYRRLQELEIPSACSAYKPLQVQVNSPLAIAQIWSVIRQNSLPRKMLATCLEQCWQLDHFGTIHD